MKHSGSCVGESSHRSAHRGQSHLGHLQKEGFAHLLAPRENYPNCLALHTTLHIISRRLELDISIKRGRPSIRIVYIVQYVGRYVTGFLLKEELFRQRVAPKAEPLVHPCRRQDEGLLLHDDLAGLQVAGSNHEATVVGGATNLSGEKSKDKAFW